MRGLRLRGFIDLDSDGFVAEVKKIRGKKNPLSTAAVTSLREEFAGAAIARRVEQGLATDDGSRVRLTRAGLLVSDALWADVLT
ncbi:MAG: hypothetical protein WCR51_00825 [Planctomycetia bacterium]